MNPLPRKNPVSTSPFSSLRSRPCACAWFIAPHAKQNHGKSVRNQRHPWTSALTLSATVASNSRRHPLCEVAGLNLQEPRKQLRASGANLHSFHYSKVISAIMSAAVLVGLQTVMTAMPAWAETTCHAEPQNEGTVTAEKCAAPARHKAAFRAAHAEVGEAPEKRRPAAAHCVAARGLPSQQGPWQLGTDQATGHRCWRLVGAIKPHARIVPGAKSSPVPKSSAVPPVRTAASASPVAAPAAVQASGPSQPIEVLTSSIAKPSETLHINLGQSPISTEAGVISTPDQVDRDELQPFDQRFAWTAGPSLIEKIAAVAATYTDAAELSAGNILEQASALIMVHGRPAIFLIAFLSVLTTILALYALVVGSLKVLRSSSLRGDPSAIRVTPQYYLEDMTGPPKARATDEQSNRASRRALPLQEVLRNGR